MQYRKWTSRIIGVLCCLLVTPAWAASQAPLTLEAANLSYSEETGAFSASGNIKMQQENTVIVSDEITGDVKTGDVVANGHVTWTEEKNTLTGEKLNYNYKTKNGQMGAAKGNMNGLLMGTQLTTVSPEKSIISHGYVTKCPAKIPDYKMTAEKIVVYPGDKLIAYNASFWIKDFKLFTLSKFKKSLKEEDQSVSIMPKIGYDSHDGIYIKQYLEYPLNSKISAMAELDLYHDRGFEPQLGLIKRGKQSTLSLIAGTKSNADDEWYDRRPELIYSHKGFPVGNLPINVNYKLYTGRIIEADTNTDLWRSGGAVSISHNPIKLTDNTTLHLGGGYEYTWYEDDQNIATWRGNVGIETALNKRMKLGIGYNHAQPNGSTPFKYDDIDINNELKSDFSWQIDRLWQVGVSTSYDLDNSSMKDVDYTIKRNLHCFEAAVTYRENRDEWKLRVGVINW